VLRVVLVDDEPPSREELRALLATETDIEILAECGNAIEGLAAIRRHRPDAVFLDIQMPRVSGLEMIDMVDPEHMPHVVFVTAFDEHALKAFEQHASDYLLKPVDPERLRKTLDWLRSRTSRPDKPLPGITESLRHVPCYARNRIFLLALDDIEYVHTHVSGVQVVSRDRQGLTELTLKLLQERTPLMRCHRQFLVNLDHVAEIELHENGGAEIVTRSSRRIPVSRRHLREIKDMLLIS
jgi:two-component system, LytTR family, response regulator